MYNKTYILHNSKQSVTIPEALSSVGEKKDVDAALAVTKQYDTTVPTGEAARIEAKNIHALMTVTVVNICIKAKI